MPVDWSTTTDEQLAVAVVLYIWGDTITYQAGVSGNSDWYLIAHKTTGLTHGPSAATLIDHTVFSAAGFNRTMEEMGAIGYGMTGRWSGTYPSHEGHAGWVFIPVSTTTTVSEHAVVGTGAPLTDQLRALYWAALDIVAPNGPIP